MIVYKDIIKAVNTLLKTKYPEITRYGNDTVDKAVPPYFFVELIPAGINRASKNMMHKACTVKITYVQKISNQSDNLTKTEEICDLLGMNIRINDRKLLILNYDHDFVGENNNILQISFGLDWWESTEWIEGDPAETFEVAVKGD
jgi:hypothetical protein